MNILFLKNRLSTSIVGKKIIHLDSIDSTNEYAKRISPQKISDGTVIFAEDQTHGKGRFGRSWFSLKGKCILCSVILSGEIPTENAPLVTAIGTLSAVEAIRTTTGLKTYIQFPNDVIVANKKVAGVLAEVKLDKKPFFILGIGINVNIKKAEFPQELLSTATSLHIELGRSINRTILLKYLLEALDLWYERLSLGQTSAITRSWKEFSHILGRHVNITTPQGEFSGTVFDLDPLEGVMLRVQTGNLLRIKGEHIKLLKAT
jgi:BirA family biotin operon repressor/biotin-[acetyl-CoA-carboxylase] ligase